MPAEKADDERLNTVLSEKWPLFPYRLDCDVSDLPSLLSMSMKSPLWEELGKRCLACAACTNVCPTCFCFDVKDEIELENGDGHPYAIGIPASWMSLPPWLVGHNFRKNRPYASGIVSCAKENISWKPTGTSAVWAAGAVPAPAR